LTAEEEVGAEEESREREGAAAAAVGAGATEEEMVGATAGVYEVGKGALK
jgi:hypothetical protein